MAQCTVTGAFDFNVNQAKQYATQGTADGDFAAAAMYYSAAMNATCMTPPRDPKALIALSVQSRKAYAQKVQVTAECPECPTAPSAPRAAGGAPPGEEDQCPTDFKPFDASKALTFAQIIGLESVKERAQEDVVTPMKFPVIAREQKLQAPNVLLYGLGGTGKCFALDTPVLLYNGQIKAVQDIQKGDILMGDDSTPRTVLSTTNGRDQMFKIVPTKGTPYVVNEPHVMVLTHECPVSVTWDKQYSRYRVIWQEGMTSKSASFSVFRHGTQEEAYAMASRFANSLRQIDDELVDIPLDDFLKLPSWKQRAMKGVRAGCDFPPGEHLLIDPYLVGHWLGDGHTHHPQITTMDSEIVAYYQEWCSKHGLLLKDLETTNTGKASTYSIRTVKGRGSPEGSNPLGAFLRRNDFINVGKHVPHAYKTAPRKDRLALLAGFIDADGSLTCGCYDIVQKSERLLDDIIFMARSLGFAAYKKECQKTCGNNGVTGTYYRCCISGPIDAIPILLSHKKAGLRGGNRNVLHYGFTVEPQGEGDYYGFMLDGNGRFLLEDFTVTHNTVLVEAIARDTGTTIYEASAGQIKGKFVGQSEKCLEKLLELGKQGDGAIIFLDEVDSLLAGEGDIEKAFQAEFKNVVQTGKDMPPPVLMAATNVPWRITDGAIQRRFGLKLYIALPTPEQRIQYLKMLAGQLKDCKGQKRDLDNITVEQWVQLRDMTKGFTPDNLRVLMETARRVNPKSLSQEADLFFCKQADGTYGVLLASEASGDCTKGLASVPAQERSKVCWPLARFEDFDRVLREGIVRTTATVRELKEFLVYAQSVKDFGSIADIQRSIAELGG